MPYEIIGRYDVHEERPAVVMSLRAFWSYARGVAIARGLVLQFVPQERNKLILLGNGRWHREEFEASPVSLLHALRKFRPVWWALRRERRLTPLVML